MARLRSAKEPRLGHTRPITDGEARKLTARATILHAAHAIEDPDRLYRIERLVKKELGKEKRG